MSHYLLDRSSFKCIVVENDLMCIGIKIYFFFMATLFFFSSTRSDALSFGDIILHYWAFFASQKNT